MARRLSFPSLLQWQLLLQRANPWLIAALAMCLAAIFTQWFVLPAIERRTRLLDVQLADSAPGILQTTRKTLVEDRFQTFRDRLANDDERTEVLKKLFTEAEKAGIVLQQGDYTLLEDADGNFVRFQILLPLKGSYMQIRIYVQTLLETIPALSLDEIGFRRESARSQNVDAHLRLTLYMKKRNLP
jgi:hypothetical protein